MQIRNSQIVRFSFLAVGLVVGLAGTVQAQGDSSLGKWKLNVAKSHYDSGTAPKSDNRVYEAWEGDGVKVTINRVEADGTVTTAGYAAHYDGKDGKYTGTPNRDAISLKRIDANTVEAVMKKGGQVQQTNRSVISNGGKVLTQTSGAGISLNGTKTSGTVTVYERQ